MRKVPTFSSGALSGEVISNRGTGAAANEKISGVKTFKDIEREKESENDKRINDNVLEVSQFEVCCYALGFKCTCCNVDFIHINTNPPEHRRSSFKSLAEIKHNQNQLIECCFDPNSSRRCLGQNWRRFDPTQIEHAKECKFSSLRLDGPMERHNTRPPN